MKNIYLVKIRTDKGVYKRILCGKLNTLMNEVDNLLNTNRQRIGIPYGDKIEEVSYSSKIIDDRLE